MRVRFAYVTIRGASTKRKEDVIETVKCCEEVMGNSFPTFPSKVERPLRN